MDQLKENIEYPGCLDGSRSCPPEDCGGAGGYFKLLEILSNPEHPKYEILKEKVGPYFESEHFDVEVVNKVLH